MDGWGSCNRVGYDSRNFGNHKRLKYSRRAGRKQDKRHYLVWLLKNEEGWTIITTLLILPVLTFFLFAVIEYWGIITIYEHTESLKYNALAKMEVNGGLTPEDKQFLIDKLIDLGADPETIRIQGDILEGNKHPVLWPGEVNLRIELVPKHFNNFMARTFIGGDPGEPLRIGVEGSAVSSRTAK